MFSGVTEKEHGLTWVKILIKIKTFKSNFTFLYHRFSDVFRGIEMGPGLRWGKSWYFKTFYTRLFMMN